MLRVVGFALLAACTSPANVEGVYDVTVRDLFDDCDISEDPYPVFQMSIDQLDDRAYVMFPVETQYVDQFFTPIVGALGLTTFIDGSELAGAIAGGFQALGDGCGFLYRLDLAAEVTGRILRGTVTVTPGAVFPEGCAPPRSCQSKQSLDGTRL